MARRHTVTPEKQPDTKATLTGGKTLWLACLFGLAFYATASGQTLQLVRPSQTDPNITQFDNYHYIYLNTNVTARPQLFVFLGHGTFTHYTYQVQTTTNLESSWINAGAPVVGDGTANTCAFNLSGLSEFFRCAVQY